MLTIAEIAKRYALPESTVRFYCKRFRAYLPNQGQGKRRRYLPEALEVFEAILAEMKGTKNARSVENALSLRFKKVESVSDSCVPQQQTYIASQAIPAFDPAILASLLENQTEALKQIAGVLGRMLLFQEKMELNAQRLSAMETKFEQFSTSLKRLDKIQDDAERLHQQDIEMLRKWLAHLAKEKEEKSA
jgi:DNA-binding transcriptional MerR regulator